MSKKTQDLVSKVTSASDRKPRRVPSLGRVASAPAQPSSVRVFSSNVAALQAGAVHDIPTKYVSDSLLSDRFGISPESIEELAQSIKEHGQKTPIVVRRVGGETDLEIVSGRRRLAACKQLGIDVKGVVRELTDEQALIEQGLENNERQDTTFIEKAMFAKRILDAGFEHRVATAALNASPSTVSYYQRVTKALPDDLILAIGPAEGVGRRMWYDLVDAYQKLPKGSTSIVLKEVDQTKPSPERVPDLVKRLRQLLDGQSKPTKQPAKSTPRSFANGEVALLRKERDLTIRMHKRGSSEFLDYLELRLDAIFAEFSAERGSK